MHWPRKEEGTDIAKSLPVKDIVARGQASTAFGTAIWIDSIEGESQPPKSVKLAAQITLSCSSIPMRFSKTKDLFRTSYTSHGNSTSWICARSFFLHRGLVYVYYCFFYVCMQLIWEGFDVRIFVGWRSRSFWPKFDSLLVSTSYIRLPIGAWYYFSVVRKVSQQNDKKDLRCSIMPHRGSFSLP